MPPAELSLLYRGTLSSCNYDCGYCPFAKRRDSAAQIALDRQQLQRFVAWVQRSGELQLDILFTPWGEALVRKHYRDALVALSRLPAVRRVGVQTNLSLSPRWLAVADVSRIHLWCTYHPGQVARERFLRRCQHLDALGVGYSVGMVALHAHIDEIQALRAALPSAVYLWLNAWDDRPVGYYSDAQIAALEAVDPHFPFNLQPAPSLGAHCRAGASALSVDGDGNVRPCHFLDRPLGNLYDGSFQSQLAPRPCTNARCDCYIGYALRTDLGFSADLLRTRPPVQITCSPDAVKRNPGHMAWSEP